MFSFSLCLALILDWSAIVELLAQETLYACACVQEAHMHAYTYTLISLSIFAYILTHKDCSTNHSTDRFSFEGSYYDYSAIVLR